MSLIKASYQEILSINPKTGKLEFIYRPYLDVRFKYRQNLIKYPIKCLIDSGADRNLFPAELGTLLGIDIESGVPIVHQGIGKDTLKAYTHNISLFVGTFSFDTEVDFSYEHSFPLLGRYGFFKYFRKVMFNEEEKMVELQY